MSFREVLELFVRADVQGAVRGVEQLGQTADRELAGRAAQATDRWANRMVFAGAGMVSVAAVAGAGLYRLGQSAVDLGETVNKTNEVFDENAEVIRRWATGAARDFGQSEQQALANASAFGNMFRQLDIGLGPATQMSQKMVELASDFASFHNADITDVLLAQQAAFRGEYDAVQRFVPTINAAAVQQRAMAETGKDNAQALTDQEKAIATYHLLIENAGDALGDFDRTSGSAANKQRILAAEFDNLRTKFGQGVIPVLSTAIDIGSSAIGMFEGLNDATGGSLGTIATYGSVLAGGAGGLLLLAGGALKARHTILELSTTFPRAAAASGAFLSAVGPAAGIMGGAAIAGLTLADALGQSAHGLQINVDGFRRLTDAQMQHAAAQLLAADGFVQLDEVVKRLAQDAPDTARRLVEAADLPRAARERLIAAIDKEVGAQQRASEATERDTQAKRDHADAVTQDADAIRDKIDAQQSEFSSELQAIQAQRDANDAVQEYLDAARDAIAHKGLNEEANRRLSDAELDVREQILGSAEAARRLAEDQAKARGETDTAKAGNEAYVRQLLQFRDTLAPDSPLIAYINGLLYRLGLAGQTYTTTINVDASQAFATLNDLMIAYSKLPANVQLGITLYGDLGASAFLYGRGG